jgi:succinate-semialdehyde dehydrogenase/glutarate-semialdehyde dehydrogenase
MIASTNPFTGETVRTYPELDDAGIEAALGRAVDGFARHRRTSFAERARWMAAAAAILDAEKERFGRLMTLEMGKTLKSAIAEAEKCAWVCRYYAEHAERMLADQPIDLGKGTGFARCLPIGAVLAVMPWNFPFWQVFRFAAPALMAGNVGLLKHASNVPGCAEAIADVFTRAGFGEGVFQSLLVGSARVARLIADDRVKAVTLTGSEPAGQKVAALAGEHLKKTVLELGGSDPFVVMPSADVALAARTAVQARMINNGQSCIAAKRFIVHRSIYADFARAFVDGALAIRAGDPLLPDTDLGPLVNHEAVETVGKQVEAALAAGATLLGQGKVPAGNRGFYPATVLGGLDPSTAAAKDEIFGPVAMLFPARDLDDAIAIANATSFGLGSSVWTRDAGERARFIDEIEAGMTYVNTMVVSDPRLPFGGVKRSGYGRELGDVGIREFVNLKAVMEA